MAKLISEVKVQRYNKSTLHKYKKFIEDYKLNGKEDLLKSDVKLEFWFSKKAIRELSELYYIINKIKNRNYQKFFLLCFSNCVKKVSYADPRISVPVKLKKTSYPKKHLLYKNTLKRLNSLTKIDVKSEFLKVVHQNILRSSNLSKGTSSKCSAEVFNIDIRNSKFIKDALIKKK